MTFKVGSHVEGTDLGVYGNSEGGFFLTRAPDTVRAPDVWFVSAARIPATGVPSEFWQLSPDLVVEVLSPSDRFNAVIQKAQDFLDAGSRLVWVIDPEARTAAIFRPNRQPELLDENGVLDGEDVIPGFSVALRDVLV